MYDWTEWVIGLLIAAMLVLMGFAVAASVKEGREWERYKIAHKCEVVGRMSGDWVTGVGPTIGGNGGVTVTTSRTPDKTGWKCDDGITYWRSN